MQRSCLGALALLIAAANLPAAEADLEAALAKIRAVQPQGGGHREAVAAAKVVAAAEAAELPRILAAMDGVNPIAENWLRGAAEAVAQRGGQQLPIAGLESFLADTKRSPRGRRLAYELIAAVDPTAESRLIPTLLDDPSVELRRDAVAQVLAAATKAEGKAAAAQYGKAFQHARDLDQIKIASDKLKELGTPADIARHMGYVMQWKLIGPFDNVEDVGWDTAYPPETTIDLKAEYPGQKGRVKWIDHATSDDYGLVDLTKALDKHKGAVTYAYAEFLAERAQPCELRFTSPNSNKVWLNGELLTANHVYHANDPLDQYTARGTLRKGPNAILLKVCQNEQEEDWAQKWEFKFRVCDRIGTAILAVDRPAKGPAFGVQGSGN
jgi:hypothetical protein